MSELSIWNLALGHLGDAANVSSPTEQSRVAELCRQFYPVARKLLLEAHPWGFATRRTVLAISEEEPWNSWRYAYAYPANALTVFAVVSPDATEDTLSLAYASPLFLTGAMGTTSTAKSFEVETNDAGEKVIFSSVEEAVARHTVLVTDTTKFSGSFTDALGWLLASYLAGPILKGETGRKEARNLLGEFQVSAARAARHDAAQRRATDFRAAHTPGWIGAR